MHCGICNCEVRFDIVLPSKPLPSLRSISSVAVSVKILKAPLLLPLWLRDLLRFNHHEIHYVNGTNYEVSHSGAFSIPHSHLNRKSIYKENKNHRNHITI